jgi:sensor histidine kinase YesM
MSSIFRTPSHKLHHMLRHMLYRTLVRPDAAAPEGICEQFQVRLLLSWSALIAMLIAVLLYRFAAQTWLLFAFQLWLGYVIGALALSILVLRKGLRPRLYAVFLTMLFGVALGAFVGSFIWFWAIGFGTFRWAFLFGQWWQPVIFGIFCLGTICTRDFVRSERAIAQAAAQRAQQAMERQRQESAKQAAEAQLRLLQAQIEPHFLLNTLANVRALVKRDQDRARDMLDHLSDYLHVALPRMRQSHSTLEREAALSESFLSIMQIRMGERLTFSFDIPAETKAISFPPMLVQTLVENAIKHGLEPSATPGHIAVSARLIVLAGREALSVSVSDTGVGFGRANTSGTRIGLINIRERLASLYGGGEAGGESSVAALEISPNQPTGVVATLMIPVVDSVVPVAIHH